jgi:A/G-specific adenine glycosylase
METTMAATAVLTKKRSKKSLLIKASKNSSENNSRPIHAIYQPLLKWFDGHGRHDLPWKQNKSPYFIWLSEIMLQQTQVVTVIPYFYRFVAAFPTSDSLAKADVNQVLALWSGLGYYARARNLHRTAQIIADTYSGVFPNTLEALISLPGIGRSTAGAIISQSFDTFGVILDGNVKRVLTRYLTLKPKPTQTAKQFESLLWEHAGYFTPKLPGHNRVGDYTQAIMDLGATLCTRTKPKCVECPLKKNCAAYLTQTQDLYPIKPTKKIKPLKKAKWLILLYQSKQGALPEILLSQRPTKGIWGGLWSFPEYPLDKPSNTYKKLASWLKKDGLLEITEKQTKISKLDSGSHIFTHFILDYEPMLIALIGKRPKILESQNSKWYNPVEILQVGLPSPITKVLNQVGFFQS